VEAWYIYIPEALFLAKLETSICQQKNLISYSALKVEEAYFSEMLYTVTKLHCAAVDKTTVLIMPL
jgi:hypothetical protein